jgi:niacin transporter
MKRDTKLQSLVIAALLCAIAIIIPMFFPKIILPPASYTLASHVPIFIALFISPPVALAVTIGSTIGFFIAGFPLVIVLRAMSHIIFVIVGAFILKKSPNIMASVGSATVFGLFLAVIHAVSEVAVVTWFYFGNTMTKANYEHGYLFSVIIMIGVGTVIHSMIDFGIAVLVWRPLTHVIQIPVSAKAFPKRREAIS